MIERRKNRMVQGVQSRPRPGDGLGRRRPRRRQRRRRARPSTRSRARPTRSASRPRAVRVVAGAIAFGVGFLVAAVFPASQPEQRAAQGLMDKAEPLKDECSPPDASRRASRARPGRRRGGQGHRRRQQAGRHRHRPRQRRRHESDHPSRRRVHQGRHQLSVAKARSTTSRQRDQQRSAGSAADLHVAPTARSSRRVVGVGWAARRSGGV